MHERNGGVEEIPAERTHKFSGLNHSPIFDPKTKDGVLAGIYSRDNDYLFAPLLPLQTADVEKLHQDIEIPLRGGQTPAVAAGTESPIFGEYRYGEQSWTPAQYREKCVIRETDLINLRKIGTLGDLMTAKELAKKLYDPITERMNNMIEISRRKALFDSNVTVMGGNNFPIDVKIPHPSYLNPATAASWSNAATGDSLADLQLWASTFVIDTDYPIAAIWLGQDQLRLTGLQAKFIARATAGGAVFDGSDGAVLRYVANFLSIGTVEEKHNRISSHSYLTANAAAGQAVVVLSDLGDIVAGSIVTLKDLTSLETDSQQKYTVASVNVATKAVTFTTNITKVGGFPKGSLSKSMMFLIPKNRCLIVGKPNNSMKGIGLENVNYTGTLGSWTSTISRYVSFDNPKPGPFSKVIDMYMESDPPRWEQVIGINGMVKIDYADAWMAPTTL